MTTTPDQSQESAATSRAGTMVSSLPAATAQLHAPATDSAETVCPVCGGRLVAEKCKVVCRSATCVYRIVFNCSEF